MLRRYLLVLNLEVEMTREPVVEPRPVDVTGRLQLEGIAARLTRD